ncbi:hypothetical protein OG223_42290 [Streptomyces sp. NBC_01478]|jgi:integrase|uniref:hypothetical protein n=1 Tax=Streptomyces sp. NBC_01478 TaxID=2903882 RepID=UPI002E318A93|nr:hypothetical protein [Streptomyces sp. NBC_01478]
MLEAGESIASLAKWLGHSDPAFTLRTYTHFIPQACARGLSAIVVGGVVAEGLAW